MTGATGVEAAACAGQTGPAERSSFAAAVRWACREHAADPASWSIEPASAFEPEVWLAVRHLGRDFPEQGWKLHVSATAFTAADVLRRTLPVLFAHVGAFKLAASSRVLGELNEGARGLSQVGKFITVYPAGDGDAVRLALALDEAISGLPAPKVPFENALRRGSAVHYRYGAFRGLTLQRRTGERVPALRSPTGELVPDRRSSAPTAPAWAEDPFAAAGLGEPVRPGPLLVADRYLLTRVLRRSARGTVYSAVDLERARTCVLKRATARTLMRPDGSDARTLLRHERDVLEALAPDPRFPTVLDWVEDGEDAYLVTNDLDAATLESRVTSLARRGRTMASAQVAEWGRQLVAMLRTIHEAGYLYRDLKSTNVLVDAAGALRLVDFEYVCPPDSASTLSRGGTRGYSSPQHTSGERPTISDDIYSLGALLLYMATGAEPAHMPEPTRPLARPLNRLNPSVAPSLKAVIERSLAPDPSARFRTLEELDAALASARASVATRAHGRQAPARRPDEAKARLRCLTLARRVGDTLCDVAQLSADGATAHWISSHPLGAGTAARDVNTGCAGTVLALAELVADLGEPTHREVLAAGACWLKESVPEREPLPGLYVGEAGVAAALLRAGQVLGDSHLVDVARARGRWIASLPYGSPDLFNGTAGRLRLHLLLWDEVGADESLEHAVEAGERLLAQALERDAGGLCWPIPEGFDGLSRNAYLGYAHGAAGIGDALLDLYDATGEAVYFEAARGAARWLASLAIPALDDGSGLNWPSVEDEDPAAAYWCHGAAGIGAFWLHAAQAELLPSAPVLAARAAAATARGVRWAGPTLCHGLAGAIELLLDAYQWTGAEGRLAEARSLGFLLERSASELEGGALAWQSEFPGLHSPDYNVGYAGIACTLLRLAQPESRPRTLDRRGFRFGGRRQQDRPGAVPGSGSPVAAPRARAAKKGAL